MNSVGGDPYDPSSEPELASNQVVFGLVSKRGVMLQTFTQSISKCICFVDFQYILIWILSSSAHIHIICIGMLASRPVSKNHSSLKQNLVEYPFQLGQTVIWMNSWLQIESVR